MAEDTSQFEDTLQPQQRPNRYNAGQGITRLGPTITGKTYINVKKKVQFPRMKRDMMQKRRTHLT